MTERQVAQQLVRDMLDAMELAEPDWSQIWAMYEELGSMVDMLYFDWVEKNSE